METESLDEYFNKMIPPSYDETARHIAYAAVRAFITEISQGVAPPPVRRAGYNKALNAHLAQKGYRLTDRGEFREVKKE
jgi:hypothetical protein